MSSQDTIGKLGRQYPSKELIPIPFALLEQGERKFQAELKTTLQDAKWANVMVDTSTKSDGSGCLMPEFRTAFSGVPMEAVYSFTGKPDASSPACPLYLEAGFCLLIELESLLDDLLTKVRFLFSAYVPTQFDMFFMIIGMPSFFYLTGGLLHRLARICLLSSSPFSHFD